MGRVDFYLISTEGHPLGKLSMVDSYPSIAQMRFEAMAGDYSGTHHFICSTLPPANPNLWNTMNPGRFTLTRQSNVWTAWVGVWNGSAWISRYSTSWVDNIGSGGTAQWGAKQLGAVDVHVGAYSTNAVLSTLAVSGLYVWGINSVTATPNIILSGRKLIIDHAKQSITIDGDDSIMAQRFIGSDFFSLPPGNQTLQITTNAGLHVASNSYVYLTRRFL
jgi:hypothetical protein